MPIGSSGPAGFCEATRMTPPGVPAVVPSPPAVLGARRRVRCRRRCRSSLVVVTAAGGDDRAEERHRQADDRATADEVTTVDASLGVRLDQVELLWADRAACSVERLPIHALPFVQLAGARAGLHPGRPNPNGDLRHGQPPFPVRVYRKWHHEGHGSVRRRSGAEGDRRRRRMRIRSRISSPNGTRARRR